MGTPAMRGNFGLVTNERKYGNHNDRELARLSMDTQNRQSIRIDVDNPLYTDMARTLRRTPTNEATSTEMRKLKLRQPVNLVAQNIKNEELVPASKSRKIVMASGKTPIP